MDLEVARVSVIVELGRCPFRSRLPMSRYVAAKKTFERCLKLHRKHTGELAPLTLQALAKLAEVHPECPWLDSMDYRKGLIIQIVPLLWMWSL
jgi:hypothetical protein